MLDNDDELSTRRATRGIVVDIFGVVMYGMRLKFAIILEFNYAPHERCHVIHIESQSILRSVERFMHSGSVMEVIQEQSVYYTIIITYHLRWLEMDLIRNAPPRGMSYIFHAGPLVILLCFPTLLELLELDREAISISSLFDRKWYVSCR
jgi:hypothetical protein